MAILKVDALSEDGTRICVKSGSHTIWIDEPPLFGGENTAPSPVEMMLASLAGALNAIGRWTAAEMNLAVSALSIHIEGSCDSTRFFGKSTEVRAGFSKIQVSISAETNASSEQLLHWQEQVIQRCPVLDNLTSPVPVEINFVFK